MARSPPPRSGPCSRTTTISSWRARRSPRSCAPRPNGRVGVAAIDHRLDGVALHRLVGFGRFLRANGMAVGTGRILTYCRAAAVLDPFARADLHAAARASLVSRPEDFPRLDALFDRYFRDGLDAATPDPGAVDADAAPGPRQEARQGGDVAEEVVVSSSRWSPAGADDEPDGEAAIRLV